MRMDSPLHPANRPWARHFPGPSVSSRSSSSVLGEGAKRFRVNQEERFKLRFGDESHPCHGPTQLGESCHDVPRNVAVAFW